MGSRNWNSYPQTNLPGAQGPVQPTQDTSKPQGGSSQVGYFYPMLLLTANPFTGLVFDFEDPGYRRVCPAWQGYLRRRNKEEITGYRKLVRWFGKLHHMRDSAVSQIPPPERKVLRPILIEKAPRPLCCMGLSADLLARGLGATHAVLVLADIFTSSQCIGTIIYGVWIG